MENQLINNQERKRYEYHVDGHIAFIDYLIARGNIYLTHTEVPRSLGGRGIGKKLVLDVLTEIKEKTEYKLVPLCPFVAAYIKKNPEWKEILSETVNIG
ncbi:GNAT family N-acetyltransferase [Flammeovirga sp. SubArs3]|uniref:GNAT family N-acetyltransferase n=1 Tax=Flammeovirga sp. SubArs3 TaxID=2995316 RepID=UPI00248BA8D0|nr:GNAT family N-acetyltransferase [Flammeovirga sp. SubArs3]